MLRDVGLGAPRRIDELGEHVEHPHGLGPEGQHRLCGGQVESPVEHRELGESVLVHAGGPMEVGSLGIVTGAAAGIGRGTAERFAAEGRDFWTGFMHAPITTSISLEHSLLFTQSGDFVWHEVIEAETEEAKRALADAATLEAHERCRRFESAPHVGDATAALHHVEDIAELFRIFHGLLNEGGFLALADLETEDGSFHPDNEGVHHFGFDREALIDMARNAGFRDPEVSTASVLRKPHGDFPVLLLTAMR